MDDAAKLAEELHGRLVELNNKVAAYRREKLAEFRQRMDKCLEGCPEDVSREVSRAIAESMSSGRYPDLCPPSRDAPDSPAFNRKAWDGRKSPPPVLRHTSGIPKDPSPRSPHAREKEFQGLFTPTYLPLLECRDSALRSPPMSPGMSPGPSPPVPSAQGAGGKDASEHAPPARSDARPDPARRLTDRSTSSAESWGSDSTKVRKSALRRSSGSSNKGSSPRRVHFKFEGEDVFPASSSPQATASTPVSGSGADSQPKAEAPSIATASESTAQAFLGTSLLDVEGEEDSLPRPRKVSSTQALQALTRSPLEEGSTWTVVNPDPELEPEPEPEPGAPVKMNGETRRRRAAEMESQTAIWVNGVANAAGKGEPPADDPDEQENPSDDEFLSMRPKGKSPSPVAKTPFARPPAQTARTAASLLNGNGALRTNDVDDDDEHDGLFDFEDEGDAGLSPSAPNSRRQPAKYLPEPDDEDDQEDNTDQARIPGPGGASPSPFSPVPSSTTTTTTPTTTTITTSATATAMPTTATGRARPTHAAATAAAAPSSASSSPPSPSSPRPSSVLFGHSIGSYMGRSMTVAPIKDPKLYDEIAGMEGVRFFVGSIKDCPDPSELGSYRPAAAAAAAAASAGSAAASATAIPGAAAVRSATAAAAAAAPAGEFVPRSFSERLALEEAIERRAAQAARAAEAGVGAGAAPAAPAAPARRGGRGGSVAGGAEWMVNGGGSGRVR